MGFLTDFLLWQGSAFRFFISRISTSDLPATERGTARDRQPGTGQHKKQTGGWFYKPEWKNSFRTMGSTSPSDYVLKNRR